MTFRHPPLPEFSRPVEIESLGDRPIRFDVHADPGERAKLARRFGLTELRSLSAHIDLERDAAGDIRLAGRITADVVQTCVVTLEPIRSTIEATVNRVFTSASGPDMDNSEEVFLAPDADEPAEHLAGGTIDVGEAVAETLGLEIDPFPRAPGAVFRGVSDGASDGAQDVEKSGLFAALAKLKKIRR